jgi:hypothetical protein
MKECFKVSNLDEAGFSETLDEDILSNESGDSQSNTRKNMFTERRLSSGSNHLSRKSGESKKSNNSNNKYP